MDLGQACDLLRDSLLLALIIAAPMLIIGLVVGVILSLLQAVTQIQEQSLVFVPKVVSLLVVLSLCGGWMMTRLIEFTRGLFNMLPHLVR